MWPSPRELAPNPKSPRRFARGCPGSAGGTRHQKWLFAASSIGAGSGSAWTIRSPVFRGVVRTSCSHVFVSRCSWTVASGTTALFMARDQRLERAGGRRNSARMWRGTGTPTHDSPLRDGPSCGSGSTRIPSPRRIGSRTTIGTSRTDPRCGERLRRRTVALPQMVEVGECQARPESLRVVRDIDDVHALGASVLRAP